jgi:hypothetical protein
MARRKQVRAWIRAQDDNTKQTFRIEVDAWEVKINGVAMLVHKSHGYHNGLELWNLTEKRTGMKVGSKRSSMESAIKLGRDYVRNLEKKSGETYASLVKDKQELWKDVMTIPEKETK